MSRAFSIKKLRPRKKKIEIPVSDAASTSGNSFESYGGHSAASAASSALTMNTTDFEIEAFLDVERLGDIAQEKGDIQQANNSYKVALNLMSKILPSNNPNVVRLQEKVNANVENQSDSGSVTSISSKFSFDGERPQGVTSARVGIKKFFASGEMPNETDENILDGSEGTLESIAQTFKYHKESGEKFLQYQNGEEALKHYNIVLKLYRKTYGIKDEELIAKGIVLSEAEILDIIGEINVLLKNLDAALTAFTESVAIRKRTSADKIALSATHHKMGRIFESMGNHEKAEKHYKRSIKWKKRNHRDMIKDVFKVDSAIGSGNEEISGKQCTVYNRIGIQMAKKASYEEALEFFHTSVINLSTSEGDHPDIDAMTYNNLGNTYSFSEKGEQALKYYLMALKSSTSKDPCFRAGAFYNCGLFFIKKGLIKQAQKCFEDALECYDGIDLDTLEDKDAKSLLSNVFNNVGNLFSDAGEFKKASKFYKRALDLKMLVHGDYAEEIFGTMCNVGTAMSKQNMNDSAVDYYEKALKILVEKKINDLRKADVLNKLGNMNLLKKDLDTAYDFYTEALTIKRKQLQNNSHEQVLLTLTNIAQVLYRQNKFDQSIRTYDTVYKRKLAGSRGEPDIEAGKIAADTSYVHYKKGDYKKADELCTRALEIYETLEISSNHRYVSHARKLYRKIIKFLSEDEEEVKVDSVEEVI